jgi:sugar O-acyltransferase (sialic acid O-acetyltransferase NeuD family)
MTTTRLVLVGAGGAGQEVAALVDAAPGWRAERGVAEVVHVDDDVRLPRVASSVAAYSPRPDDLVLCTIADPSVRRRITADLAERGALFTTFVHETAVLLAGSELGEGALVFPHVVVSTEARIGRHALLNTGALVGHHVVVGDHVSVHGYAQLLGHVTVGDDVVVGSSATVLPRARVGAGATVGAGSVVLRRVDEGATVFGNPAVTISPRQGSR